ncbi:MAG: response regulator, partial [Thermodesulfobacteriota bacterium]|nr:response regulator [Thermodesulfobacteriota bacterium]
VGTLAGGIAHAFNNLLMGIQGNASLILMDTDAAHPHYQRLKSIEKQVDSGARLTSNLLGYARKGRYEVTPIDLNALAQEVSYTFERTKREITIHRELAPDLPPIEADRGQIEQVLLNLFVNASDAMPSGGDIRVRTVKAVHHDIKGKVCDPMPGGYILLMVTDTGIGMEQDTMARIFDPFFTTKEIGGGTGLGLASAYGIVRGHRGHICVDSKKGGGTTFSVYLPASEKEIHKAAATAGEAGKRADTVLLVDDEEVVLEVGRELLEIMGYRVISAADGKEAVAIYEERFDDVDIVLLDMVMPHMGGGEAYDRMKAINPKIKAILSTGYSMDGQAAEILQRGCDAFIQKPFGLEELSKKLRQTLGRK